MSGLKEILYRYRWLTAIVLIALGIRLGAVLSMPAGINWRDGVEYDSYAASLISEHAYLNQWGYPSAYRPPGYPVFLVLTGRNPAATRTVQAILGAATVLLVYAASVKILGRREALLAAAITALYPLYIYAAGTYYPAVLLTLFMSGIFLLLIRARRGSSSIMAFWAGVLAGLMALTKGSCLPALGLAAVWLAMEKRPGMEESERSGNGSSIRNRLRPAVIFLIPILVITGSWGIRNYLALGSFQPLSTNSGYNFWLGNYPGVKADTGNRKLPGQREEELSIRKSHQGEVETSRAFLRRGLEYVRNDPGRFIRLSAAKAINLFRFYPSPMSRDLKWWEKLASALSYGAVLIPGVYFLVKNIRQSPEARLILLILIGYTVVHALFISKVRLRLPVDILLIISAAGGIRDLAARIGLNLLRED